VRVAIDEPSLDRYHKGVRTSRLAGMLLGPSLLSSTVSLLLSSTILVVAGWSYVKPDSGLYDYLFGPYGLTTILQNSSNALTAVNGALSGSTAYNVAVAVVALFVGLLVYVFLGGINRIKDKTASARDEVEFISDKNLKKQAEHRAEIRFGFRLATLAVWIVYLILFARVIVPACLLVSRLDATHYILTWRNIAASLAGLGLLLVAMHVHVILMRLLVLRPRLFGGDVVGRGGHEE